MTLHEVGQQVIPVVTGSAAAGPAVRRIAQLPVSRQGGITLATRAADRLENSPVRAIAGQLIPDSLVLLESGPGIQLGEKGKKTQRYQDRIRKWTLSNTGGDGDERKQFGDGDGMQQFSRRELIGAEDEPGAGLGENGFGRQDGHGSNPCIGCLCR
jgi:hypothetical protein